MQPGPREQDIKIVSSLEEESSSAIVDQIINARMMSQATQISSLPRALLFLCRDRDLWGRSEVLVSIIDLPLHQPCEVDDYERWLIHKANGFIVFLDPTMDFSIQWEAVVELEKLCQRINKTNTTTRVPVAICVSKIDLMAIQPYNAQNNGALIADFYRNLGDIGWESDLASIAARSRLVQEISEIIWPGARVAQSI